VHVYWTRKYKCHHRYDPETGKHWRCDRISNKDFDRKPRPGDLRIRRAMKRAARQAAREFILNELSGIDRYPRKGKRHSYAERREIQFQRERERWSRRNDYPYPYSRPYDWRLVEDEKFLARWNKEKIRVRADRAVKRVEKRLESHPWEAALLPTLRVQLEEATRAVPYIH
jgi:hypothetical protein